MLNWCLELGCGKEACLIPVTGCLGIALPPSVAHFPSGKKLSLKQRKKSREPACGTNVWPFFSVGKHRMSSEAVNQKCLEVRLEVQDARKALPQGYWGKEVRARPVSAPGIFILTWRGALALGECCTLWWTLCFLKWTIIVAQASGSILWYFILCAFWIFLFFGFLVSFPMTLPGTYAWWSVITWGKPAFWSFWGHPAGLVFPFGCFHPFGFPCCVFLTFPLTFSFNFCLAFALAPFWPFSGPFFTFWCHFRVSFLFFACLLLCIFAFFFLFILFQ